MGIRADLKEAYTAEKIDAESIKDSMATMMNALVGTDKNKDNIGNEKMGEDFVYSALVLDQLKKSNPSLAKKFADQVKKAYKSLYNKKTRESAPLLKAVNQVLQKFVDAGKLAKKVCTTIKNVAFGKSQLDSKTANQKRKPTVIDNDKEKNNVEEVIDKIAGNSIATSKEVKKEEKKFEGKIENKKTYKRKKHFLDGLKAAPVEAKKPDDPQPVDPVEPTKPETTETDFIGDTDTMGFRPKSTDGKASVVLPDVLSNGNSEVDEIVITDDDGNIIAKGEYREEKEGVDGHERKLYHFNITADKLPSKIKIKYHRKDRPSHEWGKVSIDTNGVDDWMKDFASFDEWV